MAVGFGLRVSCRSSTICPRYGGPNCLASGVEKWAGFGGDPAELALWSLGPENLWCSGVRGRLNGA